VADHGLVRPEADHAAAGRGREKRLELRADHGAEVRAEEDQNRAERHGAVRRGAELPAVVVHAEADHGVGVRGRLRA
jgi:hypothetical protein